VASRQLGLFIGEGMNPFEGINSESEAKKIYWMLAKERHPDCGGSTEAMQVLNDQYQQCLKRLDGSIFEERTYRYDQAVEQAVMDKISEILALRLVGVTVSLIGNWIWVTGTTKPIKEVLKQHKMKWHSVRECWFWNAKPWHGGRSRSDLGQLAAKYGCKEFKAKEYEKIN
jgi:hypothetical protein